MSCGSPPCTRPAAAPTARCPGHMQGGDSLPTAAVATSCWTSAQGRCDVPALRTRHAAARQTLNPTSWMQSRPGWGGAPPAGRCCHRPGWAPAAQRCSGSGRTAGACPATAGSACAAGRAPSSPCLRAGSGLRTKNGQRSPSHGGALRCWARSFKALPACRGCGM